MYEALNATASCRGVLQCQPVEYITLRACIQGEIPSLNIHALDEKNNRRWSVC